MKVLQMECFLKVCECKKYSEAAELLGMSQSSLFKQIKGMEDEFFIKIFDKDKKGVKLTAAGETLYPYVVFMYREYKQMMSSLQEFSISENSQLTIGSLYFSKQYSIIRMIREFEQIRPNIKISIDEYRSNELEALIRSGQLDAGFIYKELLEEEFSRVIPIREDYLVAVMSKDHALALRDSVKLSELKSELFILMKGDERIYKQLLKFCIEDGFVPKEQDMDIRLETMKELIPISNCITILMRTMAEDLLEDKNLAMVMVEGNKKLTLSFAVQNETEACKVFANYISS